MSHAGTIPRHFYLVACLFHLFQFITTFYLLLANKISYLIWPICPDDRSTSSVTTVFHNIYVGAKSWSCPTLLQRLCNSAYGALQICLWYDMIHDSKVVTSSRNVVVPSVGTIIRYQKDYTTIFMNIFIHHKGYQCGGVYYRLRL